MNKTTSASTTMPPRNEPTATMRKYHGTESVAASTPTARVATSTTTQRSQVRQDRRRRIGSTYRYRY